MWACRASGSLLCIDLLSDSVWSPPTPTPQVALAVQHLMGHRATFATLNKSWARRLEDEDASPGAWHHGAFFVSTGGKELNVAALLAVRTRLAWV